MRVAIIVPPMDQVPPPMYGGIGRVAHVLAEGLLEKGNDVTLYTAKPADIGCEVVMPAGLIEERYEADIGPYRCMEYSSKAVDHMTESELSGRGYDVIHNHHDSCAFVLGRNGDLKTPMLTTTHLPVDCQRSRPLFMYPGENFSAISRSQRNQFLRVSPGMNFVGVVYNAIGDNYPFSEDKLDYLFSVSRIARGKGQRKAIDIARKTGHDLVIAGNNIDEDYFYGEVMPCIDIDLSRHGKNEERDSFIRGAGGYRPDGGRIVYLGEITGEERDQLMKHARAFLFPVDLEESFGLVMLEASVVGTPVIAFNRGAVPEVVEYGKTGFYGSTIDELAEYTRMAGSIDPRECRRHVLGKFSVDRMVDGYLGLYEEVMGSGKQRTFIPIFR